MNIIGEESTYENIQKQINLTKTKLNIFLTELINQQVIRRLPLIPKLEMFSEDLIPLLAMQGLNKNDFELLGKLEKIINGKNNLMEISLKLEISPDRIKSLLDKYSNAIRIMK